MPREYHHIVGVRACLENGRDLDFLYVYTDEDAAKFEKAIEIVRNELWKTSWDDALHIADAKNLAEAFGGLSLRARYAPEVMTCHFITEKELSYEEMKMTIQSLPMEKLKAAKVTL